MRLIFVWFVLASLAVAVGAASCSIRHRSDQFECDATADCGLGRVCREGLCISLGGPDAPLPGDGGRPPDALVCPPQCTRCTDGKTCLIDCAAGANCGAPLVCPAGFNCDIRCSTDNACRSGINCLSAASCAVQCSGRSSCRGVMCGPGPCNVSCTGTLSCESVTCGASCACDVTCGTANGSCFNVQCPRFECDTGRGCSSMRALVCDTCP